MSPISVILNMKLGSNNEATKRRNFVCLLTSELAMDVNEINTEFVGVYLSAVQKLCSFGCSLHLLLLKGDEARGSR